MQEIIHILAATNKKYAPFCGVMLTSVFKNNPNADAYVLIGKSLGKRQEKKFKKLEAEFNTCIHFIKVESDVFTHVPLHYLSIETYYRILVSSLLPNDIGRVLYLDCDIIVNDHLDDLWNMDLNSRSCAVVLESDCYYPPANHFSRLNISKDLGYFNAGMMLLNLNYWRKNHVEQQILDYLETHKDSLKFQDQDVLNFVLKDSKLLVDPKYNLQTFLLRKDLFELFPEQYRSKILNAKPIIAHAIVKPWNIKSIKYPFYHLWHKYKRCSPWKYKQDYILRAKSIIVIFKRYILYPLGLVPFPSDYINEFKTNREWM